MDPSSRALGKHPRRVTNLISLRYPSSRGGASLLIETYVNAPDNEH